MWFNLEPPRSRRTFGLSRFGGISRMHSFTQGVKNAMMNRNHPCYP
jgi:hypothetical protein